MTDFTHGSYAPWFQSTSVPMGTVAMPVATLAPVAPPDWPNLDSLAKWTATMGESFEAFKGRITAELASSGPAGSTVYVYAASNAWVTRGYSVVT